MVTEFITADCLSWMAEQPADRFALTFTSPPYTDCRTYGIGAQRDCLAWVEWMLQIVEAAARITTGPVIVNAAGCTRKRNYWPAVEGLMWEWWKQGGTHQLYRPCVFHRVGIPGNGGKDWFRADWEYVACFKRPGALPWADNTAMGHPPKWAPGGEMSYRISSGKKINQWGPVGGPGGGGAKRANGEKKPRRRPSHKIVTSNEIQAAAVHGNKWGEGGFFPETKGGDALRRRKVHTVKRGADGTVTPDGAHNQEQDWQEPVLANPGNAIEQLYTAEEVAAILEEASDYRHLIVGGGVMGDRRAHENEAPFPESLAEFFIRSLCPPGGTVLDPFSGSGTTCCVAHRLGRSGVGIDIRESQTAIARRRLSSVQVELF